MKQHDDYIAGPHHYWTQVLVVSSVLAWPVATTNYFLEFTDALSPTNVWRTVFDAPAVLNNQHVLINSAVDAARYYRLRRY